MQTQWQLKIAWGESISNELLNQWNHLNFDLLELSKTNIPIFVSSAYATRIELQGFADASECAYDACIYMRTKTSQGTYLSIALVSKSRVEPLRKVNLPRLQLCGDQLLAELYQKTFDSIRLTFQSTTFWSDSTIALYRMKGQPNK